MNMNELLERWYEDSKTALQPVGELAEITKGAFEKANEQHVAVAKGSLDFCLRGFKLLGKVSDPHALVEQQVNLAKEMSEKTFAAADAYLKLTAETQTQLSHWTEKTAKTFVAQTGQATEAAIAKAENALKQAA